MRGWNWGKAEFGKQELSFMVQNRPSFEVPYTEIMNTNLAGKNEIAVEISLPGDGKETGTNGSLGGARGKGMKAGAQKDQLCEVRFYIPGVTTKKEAMEDEEGGSDAENEEEQNAANLFYETLMDKADIGEVAGDTFATFLDVLHLTPRYVSPQVPIALLTASPEDASTSICSSRRSDFVERHTITRSSTNRLRSSWFCQSQTSCIS